MPSQFIKTVTTGWNTEGDGVDDVIFIEKIIDWIGGTHNVELKEVYVAGFLVDSWPITWPAI